jgi:hypothetical protein
MLIVFWFLFIYRFGAELYFYSLACAIMLYECIPGVEKRLLNGSQPSYPVFWRRFMVSRPGLRIFRLVHICQELSISAFGADSSLRARFEHIRVVHFYNQIADMDKRSFPFLWPVLRTFFIPGQPGLRLIDRRLL